MKRIIPFILGLVVALSPISANAWGPDDLKYTSNTSSSEYTYTLSKMFTDYTSGSKVTWRRNPLLPSSAETHINYAMNQWKNASGMPSWFLHQKTTSNNPDIEIALGACGKGIACAVVDSYDNHADRDTKTVAKLLIYYPTYHDHSDDLRRNVLVHELGHAFGLADRYAWDSNDNVICGTGPDTVMAAIGCGNQKETPQTFDKNNLRDYYKNCDQIYSYCGISKAYGSSNTSVNGSGVVSSVWEHQAWNTKYVEMNYYKSDDQTWTGNFVLVHTNWHVTGTGFWSHGVYPYGSNNTKY